MKTIALCLSALLGITVLLPSCGNDAPVGVTTTAAGGAAGKMIVLGDASVVSGGGGSPAGAAPPTGEDNCGLASGDLSQRPADLLLVLDRSTSMGWDMKRDDQECAATSTTCQQRWATVTRTLEEVISASAANLHWGLKLFATPSGTNGAENCEVAPGVEVAVGEGGASRLREAIRATEPLGYTPTRQALAHAVAYLKTLSDQRQPFLLLATDGEPNCDGASPTTSAAVQVNHVIDEIDAAVAANIPVYVIGLGPASGVRNLDKFAVAGGTGHYYPATSADELIAALSTIVGQVASCVFALPGQPPDPDNLAVYLDKKIVPRDGTSGWTLGPDGRSVVFSGAYCEGIKAATYRQAQVIFGCPDTQPPLTIP